MQFYIERGKCERRKKDRYTTARSGEKLFCEAETRMIRFELSEDIMYV